jgi:hypothetical protein
MIRIALRFDANGLAMRIVLHIRHQLHERFSTMTQTNNCDEFRRLGVPAHSIEELDRYDDGVPYTMDDNGDCFLLPEVVWCAHQGPIPPGCEVFYINGDVLDNRLCNIGLRSEYADAESRGLDD